MKAILYENYGSPEALQLREVEAPIPGDDQVLIEVHAASANALDWRPMTSPILSRMVRGGLVTPQDTSVGADVAGQVKAVGANVTKFKPGDEVFGTCRGSFAEYVAADENNLALKPANVSFEAAAAVPIAALTALQGLRKGRIQLGQKVLIYGASGGVGMFAVQIAKSFGAEVTAVCSTRNLDMVRSIGADHVIDYTREDFIRDGQRFDLILAVNGYRSLFAYRRALTPTGIYVVAGGSMAQIFQGMLLGPLVSRAEGKRLGSMGVAKVTHEDLATLAGLLEAGKIAPVIDRCYPLDDAAGAIRTLIKEHAQGKVVITMG